MRNKVRLEILVIPQRNRVAQDTAMEMAIHLVWSGKRRPHNVVIKIQPMYKKVAVTMMVILLTAITE